jgi:hypothetical protein
MHVIRGVGMWIQVYRACIFDHTALFSVVFEGEIRVLDPRPKLLRLHLPSLVTYH